LSIAINVLNLANIAHLDLRPANIMWREIKGQEFSQVELQLIDFEDAVLFDYPIPTEFVKVVVTNCDARYPFKPGDEKTQQLANANHNLFFYEAVKHWTISEVESFQQCMNDGLGVEILRSLTPSLPTTKDK
jgi:hypothetical protein